MTRSRGSPRAERRTIRFLDAFSQCLQEVCTRVDLAFQHGFRLDGDRLYLSKIGDVRIKLHRSWEGEVKTLTVKRDGLGKGYACFSFEVEPETLPPVLNVVGVDVGLEKFAALSTGKHVPAPRFFRKDENALAKAQRRLSRCGEVVRKELSVCVHNCPHCSCTLHRDVNASLNILARGLSGMGSTSGSFPIHGGE